MQERTNTLDLLYYQARRTVRLTCATYKTVFPHLRFRVYTCVVDVGVPHLTLLSKPFCDCIVSVILYDDKSTTTSSI